MVERRIDSARLRSVILQRWPGLDRFPDDAVAPLLKEVALEVELDAEVTRLLCYGDVSGGAPTAAQLFQGQPPQLFAAREVAEFLGVDHCVQKQLSKRGRLPTAEPGHGYDLDKVLALRRWLDALQTSATLDEAFGWPGLTSALVELNLLEGLKAGDGQLAGVDVVSVAQLVSRVQSALATSRRQTTRAVPMHHGRQLGMDATAMAWAISQVVTGSLPALEWTSPYRLCDLLVEERRLRALAMRNGELFAGDSARTQPLERALRL